MSVSSFARVAGPAIAFITGHQFTGSATRLSAGRQTEYGPDIRTRAVSRRRKKRLGPTQNKPSFKQPPYTRRRKDPHTMAYRRYKRRAPARKRRRKVRRRKSSKTLGRPAKQHRMKHRLDARLYLGAEEVAFTGKPKSPYQIFSTEQCLDIKLNNIHDPYDTSTVVGINPTMTDVVPPFYNTMKSLYRTFKVNNVYVSLTFTNNRPIAVDTVSGFNSAGTRVNNSSPNEVPVLMPAEPIIVGAFPVHTNVDTLVNCTTDNNWPYRPGAKMALLHSQQSKTMTFKLDPAKIVGITNSFGSTEYFPSDASSADPAPDAMASLRVCWVPPTAMTTANYSNRAVSVYTKVWWDVTWHQLLNEGDHTTPGATTDP